MPRSAHAPCGAFGYVTKASAPNVPVNAMHAVARGTKYLGREIAQKLALQAGVSRRLTTENNK
jgi:DNA-binding NarL/FixJ family response regulator